MQIIMQDKKIKNNIKTVRNQILKLLNYKYLLTKKINLNFYFNQINILKTKRKCMSITFVKKI
jgi:hypothetical protein